MKKSIQRVAVTLCKDSSRHLGILMGSVDLESDPDFLARPSEPETEALEPDPETKALIEQIASNGFGNMPKIRLDDGRIVFGIECWWQEITEEGEKKFHSLPANPQFG